MAARRRFGLCAALLLFPLLSGCSLYWANRAPASAESPLRARVFPDFSIWLDRPAYVAVFEVLPYSRVSMLYPSPSGYGSELLQPGFRLLTRPLIAYRTTLSSTGFPFDRPVRYLFLVACDRPLELERLPGYVEFGWELVPIFQPGLARGSAFEIFDELESRLVGARPVGACAVDWIPIWERIFPRTFRVRPDLVQADWTDPWNRPRVTLPEVPPPPPVEPAPPEAPGAPEEPPAIRPPEPGEPAPVAPPEEEGREAPRPPREIPPEPSAPPAIRPPEPPEPLPAPSGDRREELRAPAVTPTPAPEPRHEGPPAREPSRPPAVEPRTTAPSMPPPPPSEPAIRDAPGGKRASPIE